MYRQIRDMLQIIKTERWQNKRLLRRHNAKNVPVQEKQENSVNFVPVQYTKS